jgi:hypothetical protein
MTMQLLAVALYSRGRVRRIDFIPGQLNIITGASKTGKSSILDIVDYCLGSSGFSVAAGVIRDTVEVYATVLSIDDGHHILVARRRPEGLSTDRMHRQVGNFSERLPTQAELAPNTDRGSVRSHLTRALGTPENLLEPETGSRPALSANIRHALLLTLQRQSEIANRDVLFHSQSDEFVPQAIRDTLPFFLGAVSGDEIRRRQRLRRLRRDLRVLRRGQTETESLNATPRARALVGEAVDVGLLDSADMASMDQNRALELLSEAVEIRVEEQPSTPDETTYYELLDEREAFRRELSDLKAERRLLLHVLDERGEYEAEAEQQEQRLVSLGLAQSGGEVEQCPLCESALEAHVPGAESLRSALSELQSEIGAVRRGTPRVQEGLADLDDRIGSIEQDLAENAAALRQLEERRQRIADLRDQAVRRAATRGAIGLFLDASSGGREAAIVSTRVSDLEEEIATLEESLSGDQAQGRLDSSLARLSSVMSEHARALGLEHSEHPIRLDLRRLTVVADLPSGPVPLSDMGSGENWLGYHLALVLALAEVFITSGAPVPGFLLLDQPSQVYFPPDADDSEMPELDEDRQALERVFGLLRATVERLSPDLQIIVLDHADMDASWFREAVVERWRDGRALVPDEWMDEG